MPARSTDRFGTVRVLGRRLYFRSLGSPTRGTVLVLHGGPGLPHDYLAPIGDLASVGYRVVFYDQLGCGRSERPRGFTGYTMERAGAEVGAIRRSLRLGRVDVIGHSFGGALALQVALDSPDWLRSLVIASGFASERSVLRGVRRWVDRLTPAHRAAFLAQDRTGKSPRNMPGAQEEFRRRFVDRMSVQPHELRRAFELMGWEVYDCMYGGPRGQLTEYQWSGTMRGWDVTARLGRIRQPTLITVGEFDESAPDCAREIQRGIPGSKLALFKGSAHLAFFDRRADFIQLVASFLASR